MKPKNWLLLGLILVILACIMGWRLSKKLPLHKTSVTLPVLPSPTHSPISTASSIKNIPPKDLEIMRQGLEAWGKRMIEHGAKIIPPPKEQIRIAVASADKPSISRAFHDIVYGRYKREEVLAVLRNYLDSEDMYVQYKAAESLYIMGDKGGYNSLLGLVQLANEVPGIGKDVRIDAAETLGKFREKGAGEAIYSLYKTTLNSRLLSELNKLGLDVANEMETGGFSASAIQGYAKTDTRSFIPQISEVFELTPNPQKKVAAAWALASMNKDQKAKAYLFQQAQAILINPSILDGSTEGLEEFTAGTRALQYLATMQDSIARDILEQAIYSQDVTVVENAIVNLLYNQGGSEKAMQVIIDQLNNPTHAKLEWEFVFNIAADHLDNPKIQAAGEKFSHQDSMWQHLVVERQEWPIYNWIDNYVVKLKKNF